MEHMTRDVYRGPTPDVKATGTNLATAGMATRPQPDVLSVAAELSSGEVSLARDWCGLRG